ncbi:hypothetical protein [Alistipes sp.]|uniref:hypothetical protein n=1 Tax=Alistipes sp. TaxID=1872444 RepID=UPI003A85C11F
MRKFVCLLVGVAVAFAGVSCSDEGESVRVEPEVGIVDGSVESNAISCTIVPAKATACAYTYVEKGAPLPSAERILAEGGNRIAADAATTVRIGALKWNTTYVVIAAVASGDGLYAAASVELTVGEEPDLSTDLGAGANCYIVSQAGDYSFVPQHVNGLPVENISSVAWIWSTKVGAGNQQKLVSDVAYRNGKVRFTATGERGNVVLAAFSASGSIVWSWHIWCTEEPQTRTHTNGSVFQDRWLGAVDTAPGARGSFGLLYQWGRKDPFFGGVDAQDCEDYAEPPFTVAVNNTIMNPDYGLEWKFVDEGADPLRAAAEPTHFFHAPKHDWLAEHNETLWARAKTDYDPCPAGYRVPTTAELSDLESVSAADFDAVTGGFNFTQNGVQAWWQGCGNRDIGGYLTIFGQIFAWTSTVQSMGSGDSAFYFSERFIVDDWGAVIAPGNRSFAQSIRCVAE